MPLRDYSRLEGTAFPRTRLAELNVLVVGAGALGNEVIKNLALLGVGRLGVLDRDRIEVSNLTRSVLFCTPDIDGHVARGTPKAELAAARAVEINPDVRATPYIGEIADLGSGTIRRTDLVFSCLDNEMARLELGWVCTRLDKPLVDGGLGLINSSSGLISLFPGAEGPCYACRKGADRRRALLQELQGREDPCGLKDRLQRQAEIIPTTPTMASIVGAIQVEMGVRHVCAPDAPTDRTRGVSYRVTLHPYVRIDPLTFERSPNCPLHQSESIVRDVTERADRRSDDWTAAELLATAGDGAFLTFDWPMTARASCRACGHAWEPLMRRARFRGQRCPACGGDDVAETEVLTGVDAASPWATRTLRALGLPRGHVHEIVLGADDDAPHRHVEVTGDFDPAREGSLT
jgi:molybdopterin/thiamine biosynthesis adenylyltransferase